MTAVPSTGSGIAELLASVPIPACAAGAAVELTYASADIAEAVLLLVSGQTQPDLERSSLQLREFLAGHAVDMRGLAQALQQGNGDLPYRQMLVCAGRQDAVGALAEGSKRVLSSRVDAAPRPIVFLLPGVGDQYVGMGDGLYAACETFRDEVDRCAELLRALLGLDIRDVVYPANRSWKQDTQVKGIDLKRMLGQAAGDQPDPETVRLNTTTLCQPALFTIEYAMARQWASLGVTPGAIIGHSMGEYVAACLAGVLSLEDALKLVAARAQLVGGLPEAVMLAVMMAEEELLLELPRDLSVSLINGPSHCVIAGPPDSVAAFERALTDRGVIARRVQNGHAFHTKLMEPVAAAFEAEVRKARLNPPCIPYTSNVTGTWIEASEATDPSYWVRHLTRTARFNEALHELWQLPNPLTIECGPGRTLSVLAIQHPQRKGPLRSTIGSIRQRYENVPDMQVLLGAVGRSWLAGTSIRWEGLYRQSAAPLVPEFASSPELVAPASVASTPEADGGTVTEREKELAAIWSRALGRDDIGVNESFGALGGDSLSSIAALLEMKRVGVPDGISRGLYQGLTIREMVRQEAEAGGASRQVTAVNGVPVGSIETPVFVRALGIFLVMASHFGLSSFEGNPVLMVVSGLSFAKFQLRTIAKERSIAPTFRFAWKIALPSLIDTMARQIAHHTFYPKSFLLMDNLMEPFPFGPHESPYYLDMLIQDLIIASIPLAVPAIRRMAVEKPLIYGFAWYLLSWLGSIVVPMLFDPAHVWKEVPQVYMWLLAMGWCAAYSTRRWEKMLLTASFLGMNLISHILGVGWDWYVMTAAVVLVWFDEIPALVPSVLARAVNAVAAASLFIYLTHFSFKYTVDWIWRHFAASTASTAPAWVVIPIAAAGGYVIWRIWEYEMRVIRVRLGLTRAQPAVPATGSW